MKTWDMQRLQSTDSTGAGRLLSRNGRVDVKQASIVNAQAICSDGFGAGEEAS